MTCEHIQQIIKKINNLLLEFNNTGSELYQTSEPLYKEENIEIKKETINKFLIKRYKEKPIFDPEKATFINKVRVEELQKEVISINQIIADCNCYNEIIFLKRENGKKEELNKELDKTQKSLLVLNERNAILAEKYKKKKGKRKD